MESFTLTVQLKVKAFKLYRLVVKHLRLQELESNSDKNIILINFPG